MDPIRGRDFLGAKAEITGFGSKDVEVEAQFRAHNESYLTKLINKISDLDEDHTLYFVPNIRISRPITVYFDTEDHDLRRNFITLRYRYPFHDPSNPDNCFPSSISVKSGCDLLEKNFEDCSRHISERLEIEEIIDKDLVYFDPQKDWEAIQHPELRDRIRDAVGSKPIVPLFLTDVTRVAADLVVMAEDQQVHLELAVDPCHYYLLQKDQRLAITQEAADAGCYQSVLTPYDDLRKAQVNGRYIGNDPQFELEFKTYLTSKYVNPTHIVYAMNVAENRIKQVVGPEFGPKNGKAKTGFALYEEAVLPNPNRKIPLKVPVLGRT